MSAQARKELLKLSQKELQKKCKKYKLSTTGSKKELIQRIMSSKHSDKILKQASNKQKKLNLHRNALIHVTPTEARIHLIHGFVKAYKVENYPTSLTLIFVEYLGNIFLTFDVYLQQYAKYIQQDNTLLCRESSTGLRHRVSDRFTVGCSRGFNEGIHEFTIKILKVTASIDGIGVVDDISICQTPRFWIQSCCELGIFNEYLHLRGGPEYKEGDVVTVRLNCKSWTVKYYKNGKNFEKVIQYVGGTEKRFKTIHIEHDRTYYFVLSSQGRNAQYKILYLNSY
eukprot:CAMPEP_0197033882 /NCGR_PEP_ID=MMETSP1384-20130603/12169_1 /TAXON_ID=29189 /ORGANISM="Ammonia sp." /LENGTH=282 /DNA_ID=CAMNT_0042463745 /DNA_START=21 /DNA_END=869 /DNA_ORIENTATION=-